MRFPKKLKIKERVFTDRLTGDNFWRNGEGLYSRIISIEGTHQNSFFTKRLRGKPGTPKIVYRQKRRVVGGKGTLRRNRPNSHFIEGGELRSRDEWHGPKDRKITLSPNR